MQAFKLEEAEFRSFIYKETTFGFFNPLVGD